MKKMLIAMAALLALAMNPAVAAISAGHALMIDAKVAGVYRQNFGGEGLVYIKRQGLDLYIIQDGEGGYFTIDSMTTEGGHQQLINMLGDNDEITTLELIFGNLMLTLPDGDAIHMSRVRNLTQRDAAKVEPFLLKTQPAAAPQQPVAPQQQDIKASFDCAKAGTRVEKMICSDAALAELDTTLAARYESVLQMGDDKTYWKQDQRKWVKERNQCQQPSCLAHSYNVRIQDLEQVLQYLNKPAEYR